MLPSFKVEFFPLLQHFAFLSAQMRVLKIYKSYGV